MDYNYIPVLLLPEHHTSTPAHLPILLAVQKVLNDSYRITHGTHPEIFGDSFLRLGNPAHLAETVGEDGFTVVIIRIPSGDAQGHGELKVGEVVATGSVKDFGSGNVEDYIKWSKPVTGKSWKAKEDGQEDSEEKARKGRSVVHKYELTAFAVAPNCQAGGLGARIIQELEWLVESDELGPRLRHALCTDTPTVEGVSLDTEEGRSIQGIDLNRLKEAVKTRKEDESAQPYPWGRPKLVLTAIRELGTEAYYQRRGFKSLWSGTVPKGMYDCRTECTLVYMEKE